jgi:hypothetical protein
MKNIREFHFSDQAVFLNRKMVISASFGTIVPNESNEKREVDVCGWIPAGQNRSIRDRSIVRIMDKLFTRSINDLAEIDSEGKGRAVQLSVLMLYCAAVDLNRLFVDLVLQPGIHYSRIALSCRNFR